MHVSTQMATGVLTLSVFDWQRFWPTACWSRLSSCTWNWYLIAWFARNSEKSKITPQVCHYLQQRYEAHLSFLWKKKKKKDDASSTQSAICLTWKQNVGWLWCCGRGDGWVFTSALNSADFGSIPSPSRKCFTARGFHFWESVSLTWPCPAASPNRNKLFLFFVYYFFNQTFLSRLAWINRTAVQDSWHSGGNVTSYSTGLPEVLHSMHIIDSKVVW